MAYRTSARSVVQRRRSAPSRPRLEMLENRFAPGTVFALDADNLFASKSISLQTDEAATLRPTERVRTVSEAKSVEPSITEITLKNKAPENGANRGGGGPGGGHGSNGVSDPLGSGSFGQPPLPAVTSKIGTPSAPEHLTATVSTDHTGGYLFIHLHWVYEELGATHFDVNRAVDHGAFNLIAQVSYQTNKENYDYTDGPVTRGPHYEYCVKAVNKFFKSACAKVEV